MARYTLHDDVIKFFKIFSASLAICAGNWLVTGELSAKRPVTRSFDVFFDLRPNERLSKQSWSWCLRRHRAHCDVTVMIHHIRNYLFCYNEVHCPDGLFTSYPRSCEWSAVCTLKLTHDVFNPHHNIQHQWTLLLAWFNFNPSMDK